MGLGLDYVVLTALRFCWLLYRTDVGAKEKVIGFIVYCVGLLGVSYFYNYGVKYEKANSVLTEDLQKVVPKGSKVFGPFANGLC